MHESTYQFWSLTSRITKMLHDQVSGIMMIHIIVKQLPTNTRILRSNFLTSSLIFQLSTFKLFKRLNQMNG